MRSRFVVSAVCLTLLTASMSAQEPPVALTKVPGDAALFGHIKFSEVWDHPIAILLRTVAGKELEEPFGEIRKGLGHDLADLDTFTVFMPELMGPGDEEFVAFLFTTRKPYDQAAILKVCDDEDGKPDENGCYVYDKNGENGRLVHFTTPTTFAILPKGMIEKYTTAKPELADGPIHGALQLAASGEQTAVGSMNLAKTPRDMLLEMPPPEIRVYLSLFKSETIFAWGKLDEQVTVHVRFNAEGNQAAIESEDALKILARLLEQYLEDGKEEVNQNAPNDEDKEAALMALDTGLASLKTVKITREGASVEATGNLKLDPKLIPKVVKLINSGGPATAAAQATSQNNLKQIGLALHNYHDANGAFPPAAIVDKTGKPLLSWRVAILPYVEQQALYNEFKLDEPWDSEHNKPLSETAVKVFVLPGVEGDKPWETHYRAFVGSGALFDQLLPNRIQDISDGTSNTIMVAEAAEAVPWSKPDDLTYDPKKPLPELYFNKSERTNVLIADGSVRALPKTIAERTLRLLITRSDGQVIPDDF